MGVPPRAKPGGASPSLSRRCWPPPGGAGAPHRANVRTSARYVVVVLAEQFQKAVRVGMQARGWKASEEPPGQLTAVPGRYYRTLEGGGPFVVVAQFTCDPDDGFRGDE